MSEEKGEGQRSCPGKMMEKKSNIIGIYVEYHKKCWEIFPA